MEVRAEDGEVEGLKNRVMSNVFNDSHLVLH